MKKIQIKMYCVLFYVNCKRFNIFLYQNKATVRYKIKEFCNFAAL